MAMPIPTLADPGDIPPDFENPVSDSPPLRCEVDGCDNPIVKPARGRTPKRCDFHRANRSPAGTNRTPTWRDAAQVEEALTRYFNVLGAGVSFVNEYDGTVITTGGPAIAHELVELAKTDKKLREKLEFITKPGKYGPLTLAVASVALPIMANHGMLPQFRITGSDERKEAA